ncbi:MAG: hypothetical protein AMS20_00170 [Gemmatimonas sp. SG8_28]|nr:MAG: hypothetical protein AMS20_00170 [Gemmatimonas sp. SG8_28]
MTAPWEAPKLGERAGHDDYPIVWAKKLCRNPRKHGYPAGCGRRFEGWVWVRKPYLTPQVEAEYDGEVLYLGLCDDCVRQDIKRERAKVKSEEQAEREAIEEAELEPPRRAYA